MFHVYWSARVWCISGSNGYGSVNSRPNHQNNLDDVDQHGALPRQEPSIALLVCNRFLSDNFTLL